MTKEYFYGGSYDSMKSQKYEDSSMSYQANFSTLGTSLDARTANQVKEVSKHLNAGLKVFEVAAHSPEVFDAMPKDQLTEIRRLSKLTGSEATIHGPMIDPSGITQNGFQEINRKAAEEQLWNALQRSAELTPTKDGKPQGNVVFTMHASTVGIPPAEFTLRESEGKDGIKTKSVLLIDTKGTIHQIKEEPRYFGPEDEKNVGKLIPFDQKTELKRLNDQTWQKQLTNINWYADSGEKALKSMLDNPKGIDKEKGLHPEQEMLEENSNTFGVSYLKEAYVNLRELFDLAYRDLDQKERKKLDEYNKGISQYVHKFNEIKNNPESLKIFAQKVKEGVAVLNDIHPEIFKPLRQFAIDQTSETISNLAIHAYNEFEKKGLNAPVISIENHPAQQSLLTTGKDLKDVIEASRNQFIEKAVKEGASKSEAKKEAEKLIGATWDVGHINMLKRYGYNDKDIEAQTEAIAPYVKHIHLSDNFGFEHTELPMGMGNVPMPAIMKIIDANAKGKKGFEGKKVAEALSWWQHFSEQGTQHAIIPTMNAFNSPIYGMKEAPYWSQSAGSLGAMGGYFGFPMSYLPEKHFSTYGTGFSALPQDLGGQIPGTQSKFAGAPNA